MKRRGFIGLPIILTAVFLLLATSGGVYYYKNKKNENIQQEQQVKVVLPEDQVATPSSSLKPVVSPIIQALPTPSPSPEPKYFDLDFDGKKYRCPEDKGYIINPVLERHQATSNQQESNVNQKEQCESDFKKCYEGCENDCDVTHLPQPEKCYEGACVGNCQSSFNCESITVNTGFYNQFKTTAELKIEVEKHCE